MGSIGYSSDTAWFANQFISRYDESLSAFGIYTFGASTYSVNISVNNKVYTQSGSVGYGGYHTIKLNNFIDLNEGDIFKIAVKLTTPNSIYPIAIESNYGKFPAYAEANQSFISSNGINWNDLTNIEGYGFTNVCLKAYTFVKSLTSIDMEDISVNVFENGSYIIDVHDNKGNLVNYGNITLYYDNVIIGDFEIYNGTYIWNFTNLSSGIHNIKVIYNENYRYSKSVMNKNITVNKLNTTLSVKSINADALSSITLIANVNSTHLINESIIIFFINGKEVGSSNVINGIAKLNYTCGSAGNFVISARFNENDFFKFAENSSNLVVNKLNVSVMANNITGLLNTKTNLSAYVNSRYPVDEGFVVFFVDAVEVGSSNVSGGIANLEYTSNKVGTFAVRAIYKGSDIYNENSSSSHIFVDYLNTTINFNTSNVLVFSDAIVNVSVVDVDKVKVIYENGSFEFVNVVNGQIIIPTSNWNVGDYNVSLVFLGDEIHRESNIIVPILISKRNVVLSISHYSSLGDTIDLKVNLISNYTIDGYVTFYVNGEKVATVGVNNNQAICSYKCSNPGNFTLRAVYEGNDIYSNNFIDSNLVIRDLIKMTIKQNNTYYNSSFITITLNQSINGQKISLKFSNNKTATVSTNSKGIATYYIPFAIGSYTVNASAYNDNYDFEFDSLNFNIIKAPATLSLSNITTTYNSGKYFQIKVINSKTKQVMAGVKLKLNIYTGSKYKTVYVTTGSNGIAKYSGSSLSIGTHKIIVYNGFNNIEAKSKTSYITVKKGTTTVSAPVVKNKYKKSAYFKITVKNKASGKVISGLYLKIKVYTGKKYKTYTVKTNSKGIAQLNTKALAKGTHKVVITTTSKYYTVSKSGYLIKIV